MRKYGQFLAAGIFAASLAAVQAAHATSKGLNQIPTPDIQPLGQLSVSYQQVNPSIDNESQIQTELGITPRAEIAAIEGLKPGETRIGAEYAILQNSPYLLSTGFFGWSTRGNAPDPLIEAGYYKNNDQFILGAIRNDGETDSLLGYSHAYTPSIQIMIDYEAGASNYSSYGATYTWFLGGGKTLSLNPAVYRSNSGSNDLLGYAVLTYNVQLWK